MRTGTGWTGGGTTAGGGTTTGGGCTAGTGPGRTGGGTGATPPPATAGGDATAAAASGCIGGLHFAGAMLHSILEATDSKHAAIEVALWGFMLVGPLQYH